MISRWHLAGPKESAATLFRLVVLFAIALAIYSPALRGDWLWDDDLDVTGNLALRDAAGLWRIWFYPVGLYDYYPIKYTVQWVQWHLWGANTLGYHVTNVALHAFSALLLWRVLERLGARSAWLGAALFLVHPLAVESVAWITELKNTLSLPFLLLAFLRFIAFEAGWQRRDLVAAVAFFVAAVLCKTSVVMFPVTLLVFVWWRRHRVTAPEILTIVPFFVVSFVFGLVTLWFQHHRAIGGAEAAFNPVGGILARLACAGTSLAFYILKAVVPANLMPIYPQWSVNPPTFPLFLPWLLLTVVVAWFWSRRRTWGRAALFGLSWFVLHLVPVLGFVPISSQRFTWVMDHLTYVPLLGLIGLAVAGFDRLTRRSATLPPVVYHGVALILCAVFAFLSFRHAAAFRSEETLWTDNVRKNPAAWMAQYNLGTFAAKAGRTAAAIEFYRAALSRRPDYPEAWNNLGIELRNQGDLDEAIAAYERALQLRPDHVAAHNNLGAALAAAGRLEEARSRCDEALRLNPNFPAAHRNLGNILARLGRNEDAIAHFRQALALQPVFPEAENDLGVTLANAGQPDAAISAFTGALGHNPDYAEAHNNLGSTLRDLGRRTEALTHFQRALEISPTYATARYNLASVLVEEGRTEEAAAEFEQTLRLDPAHADAHFNLGNLRAMADDNVDALGHYLAALQAQPAHAAAHRNAGIVLTRLGRVSEAVTHFEAAVAAQPDFADAHLSLAQSYQALGRIPEAIASYEAARRLRPDLPPLAR